MAIRTHGDRSRRPEAKAAAKAATLARRAARAQKLERVATPADLRALARELRGGTR